MLAALELNDPALLIQAEDGALHAEPGFARLTPEGIVTGEEAHALAWREPQHTYNQYWCHLNQVPLAARNRWARHHADIAFAQLRHIWESVGSPGRLLVLAPASFSDEHLSLALGLIKALPAEVIAVIDSALAACLERPRETLHVDVQLHQTVLTVCGVRDGTLHILDQDVYPGLGLMQIQNSVARHISNRMIDSYRYDPLHTSEAEQAIHDRIPSWLMELSWQDEVTTTIKSDKGELPCVLRAEDVRRLIAERLAGIRSFLGRYEGEPILLSHAAGPLAGLADEFAEAEVAGESATTDFCLTHQSMILDQVDDLYRIRALDVGEARSHAQEQRAPLATHSLYADRALPLSRPVSIRMGQEGLQMSSEVDRDATLTVALRNGSLRALYRSPDADAALPRDCRPGEIIRLGAHRLTLIEVRDD